MAKKEIDTRDTSQIETNVDGATSIQCTSESSLQPAFLNLGLNQEQVEFMLANGTYFLGRPQILGRKLKISEDLAVKALEIFKISKEQQLTNEDIEKIKICLEENPDINNPQDIALLSEVDQSLVLEYFERQPLTNSQKELIGEMYEKGNSANEISEITKIPPTKIKEYIESTFAFSGEEGNKVFQILNSLCGGISIPSLRNKLKQGDLKLQDRLISIQHTRNTDYETVEQYLARYAETQGCLEVEQDLNIDEILLIKQSNKDNIEVLSPKLNKVESVIRNYLHQYFMHPVEDNKKYKDRQANQIKKIYNAFENIIFSLDDYRTIATHPFEDIIYSIKTRNKSKKVERLLVKLLPYAFYLLKCNLPLEEIAHIISNTSNIPLTTHEIFHIIFQLSDSVLRGLCIEHYSFSNPVPLYYPRLIHPQIESRRVEFEICKELWYCLEQYNGLISFGLGRASWNAVGKSTLLDLIFETDFVKGNPRSSAFHYQSIDIQLTRNLFGEAKNQNSERTKWAYIDCHHYSNFDIIQSICSHLDVALIHVCVDDYKNNRVEIEKELSLCASKYIYILLRDCECDDVIVRDEIVNGTRQRIVYIPDLTKMGPRLLRDSLKSIGYEIFSKSIQITKLIQSQFILEILQYSGFPAAKELQSNKKLVENITQKLDELGEVDFNIFHYYPQYVEYMRSFNQASCEVDQNTIDELNSKCNQLDEKLRKTRVGEMIVLFCCILQQENFQLILWKLSRELFHLSEILNLKRDIGETKFGEQRNAKYTIELLWRETLLFYKYAENNPVNETYRTYFTSNYSNFVENGGAFELIDGDNLRFFIKEIDALLFQYYKKQTFLLRQINERQSIRIKPAPIVVSIFGPQSSGKSTLLNYCFGCNFLTSAGRCTRGIYASLSKLDRPVNLSQSLLILDTEGLDAIERDNIKDTSMIHFDRTMVLFCLSVSQVVIINVKGDIGSEMLDLLQICAYSLNRLKVSKVKAPKLFFVLNQQADPDINKHLNTINILMEKLNKSAIIDSDGVKTSDLIQISIKNTFILPFAFNSEKLNKSSHNKSNVIKLSPTIAFADKCTDLRLAIIDELDQMPLDDRAPFQTMSEWLEMAGAVWNAILQHRVITKWRNLKELNCQEKLDQIATDLVKKYFHNNNDEFQILTNNLCLEIHSMDLNLNSDIILSEQMSKLDEVFDKYKSLCMSQFYHLKENDCLLQEMGKMCDEAASNLEYSINIIRKQYDNRIRLRIKSHLNLLKRMKEFQLAITGSIERYLNCDIKDVENAFDEIWRESFGNEVKEEYTEYEEIYLSQLYLLFKLEFDAIESEQVISHWFNINEFCMNEIIVSIKEDILGRFHSLSESELIVTLKDHHVPIKGMIPYNGMPNYSYMCQSSLYKTEKSYESKFCVFPLNFIPAKCHDLLYYCSGYYDQSDIALEPNKSTQVNILKSKLLDPQSMETSAWEKFINDISSDTLKILEQHLDVSSVVAKEIIQALCFRIRLLNYEIGFIHARLSSIAERSLVNLVFAYAFEYHCNHRDTTRRDSRKKKFIMKTEIFQILLENIGDYKLIRKGWNRDWMAKWDREKSQKIALDYIDSVKKELVQFIHENMVMLFENKRESLSHESLLSLAHELLLKELAKEPSKEVTNVDNFVVQFICNRNTILEKLFQEKFDELELSIHSSITESLKTFHKENFNIKNVFNSILSELQKIAMHKGSIESFDSDNNFALFELDKLNPIDSAVKKLPFRAMVQFLKMYLDPKLPQGKFMKQIFSGFEIDGLKVVASDNYALCSKPIVPILDEDTFQKLVNTGIFNSTELIFNIFEYVKQFQDVINCFEIELKQNEFHEMTASLRKEFRKKIFGCPSQCPSCGKFCEREVHPNEGKCQIKTGHQISSMGGKVWNADKDNTAVLFMCDDYKNYTRVMSPCGVMEWGEFKDKCGSEWNWTLPTDKMSTSKQLSNQNIMKDVWNKFGRGILNYYQTQGTRISHVPYTDSEEVEMKKRLGQANQSAGRGSVSSGDIEIFIDYKN